MLALCYFVPFLKDFMGIFCFIFPRPGERQRCYGRVTYTTGSKNVEGCCVPTIQIHARGVLTLGPPVELLRVPALQGMEGLGKQPTKPNQQNFKRCTCFTGFHKAESAGVSAELWDGNQRPADRRAGFTRSGQGRVTAPCSRRTGRCPCPAVPPGMGCVGRIKEDRADSIHKL